MTLFKYSFPSLCAETLGVLDLQPADWTWTAESQFKGFFTSKSIHTGLLSLVGIFYCR